MITALAPVASLLLGVAILLTGQGLLGTLIPIRASLESFSTVSIGVMGAGYFFGFMMGCLKGGELVRRVGHVRVFLAMTAVSSSTPLLNGLFVDIWIWIPLRILTGFCFAVLYLVIESWLNETATNETRGTVFAAYVMISLTVLAGGQMMTLLYDPQNLQLFALAAVLVSLGALPVALSTATLPAMPTRTEINLRELFHVSPAGVVGCLGVGLANGSFWALAPVYVGRVFGDATLAPWFMTASVLGGAILQWPLGWLSDRWGRRSMLYYTTASGALAGLALAVFGSSLSLTGLCMLAAVWGSSAFPLYAIAVAHTNDYAEADQFVMVSSGLLLMYGIGAVIGPFIASALMTWTGAQGLYGFSAFVHLTLLVFVFVRRNLRESAAPDEQIAFVDALNSTYTASHVFEENTEIKTDED